MNAVFDSSALSSSLKEGLKQIEGAQSSEELESVHSRYFGSQGLFSLASKSIGSLQKDERKEAGEFFGRCKKEFDCAFLKKKEEVEAKEEKEKLDSERVDMTLPFTRFPMGSLHPVTLASRNIEAFFTSLGWSLGEGPEIEHAWYNFDALNFPPDHPARQMQDTFYMSPEESCLVLRTQTSSTQVRELISGPLPLYTASIGKVFRSDPLDAFHSPVFHQCEGLAVDEGLSVSDLKGVLKALCAHLFGEAEIRLRPSYFPFTEPSFEMDMLLGGEGGKWVELAGAGMVHPNVLKSAGVDPEKYTGFAFGIGIERVAMLKYGIKDMHDLVEGDERFSRQFAMGE